MEQKIDAALGSLRAELDKMEDEQKAAFLAELAALAEGYEDADSYRAARAADADARAGLEQTIAQYAQDNQLLRVQAEELALMKKAAAAQLFVQAGAVDGEYLAERLRENIRFSGGQLQEPEALAKLAREQYPGLFRRELTGVRPAEVKEVREPARELSFLERARLFEERPGDYRMAFGRP